MQDSPLKLVRAGFRKLTGRPKLKTVNRGVVLVSATVLALGSVGAAQIWQLERPGTGTSQTISQQHYDQSDATTAGLQTPTLTTTTPDQTPADNPKNSTANMQIYVDIPRTTFQVGEDSGEITVRTSTGAAVDWGFYVDPNQAVSVVVKYIYAPGKSPTAKIKLITGNAKLAEPGTYTFIVKAYKPGNMSSVLATKSITITLEPIIPFTFDIEDKYLVGYEDTGEVCTSYNITLLPHLNLMNINVTAQVVAGDAAGIYVSVHPPSYYYTGRRICVGLTESGAPGRRTIRATATAYEHTTTDDLEVEIFAAE